MNHWEQMMCDQRAARDRRIRELKRLGVKITEIAKRHGLTRQRVHQILARKS